MFSGGGGGRGEGGGIQLKQNNMYFGQCKTEGPVYRMDISVNWPSSLFQTIQQTSLPDLPYTAGFRIRIRIQLFTLMRIRVHLYTPMRIQIRILLLIDR
jgi:hypothetical protein